MPDETFYLAQILGTFAIGQATLAARADALTARIAELELALADARAEQAKAKASP